MSRRWGVWGLLLLAVVGCVSPQTRPQTAEDAERENDLKVLTVGDVTDVFSVGPVQVSGVGIVTGLRGTGGSPHGTYRTMLEQQLRKQKIENVKAILDSPDNALVLVTTFIPSGARRGDKLDVEVTLPPGSKATSLASGILRDCPLRNHDTTKNVAPEFEGPNRLLPGHVLARARGPLLVGVGNGEEPAEQKRGRVWQGAISFIDLPFYLVLDKDEKSARVAHAVAERLDAQFREDPQKLQRLTQQQQHLLLLDDVTDKINRKFTPGHLPNGTMAKVVNKEVIQVNVPFGYRFSPERYLRVARQVPLREDPEQQGRYRRRLQKMIADPAETARAAVRLEALGKDSVPVLKEGLKHEHPLVRFACAEALCYLDSTAGVDELARLARQHPLLTGSCLIALANLDEGTVCRSKLEEMLAEDDPALRCGAFYALRLLAERDPPGLRAKGPEGAPYQEWLHTKLGGEHLNGSFWLHRVARSSARLVHFAVNKRAEVVLFGDEIVLTQPVSTQVGREFTLVLKAEDDRCTVSRFSADEESPRQAQCSRKLEDVIRAMGRLGAEYPDVVDLLHKLEERQCLNCAVKVDTFPAEAPVEVLAECGRSGQLLQADMPLAEPLRKADAPATAQVGAENSCGC